MHRATRGFIALGYRTPVARLRVPGSTVARYPSGRVLLVVVALVPRHLQDPKDPGKIIQKIENREREKTS